jgi:hypothetical protein
MLYKEIIAACSKIHVKLMNTCLFCVLSVCRADHSSRGVLPIAVCLSEIVKSRQWEGPDPLALLLHRKKNCFHFVFEHSTRSCLR